MKLSVGTKVTYTNTDKSYRWVISKNKYMPKITSWDGVIEEYIEGRKTAKVRFSHSVCRPCKIENLTVREK